MTSASAFAQVAFEPGYFIDNDGIRVACLVKNEGWFRNPLDFEYQLEANGETLTRTIAQAKEFGVGELRFLRQTVTLDTSSQDLRNLSINSGPEFGKRTIYLQQLVDGPAKLYRYRTNVLQLFFFSVRDAPIKQLIYKQYSMGERQYSYNNSFKQQLKRNVACDEQAALRASAANYQVDDITRVFVAY
jgi:hypothetical protein